VKVEKGELYVRDGGVIQYKSEQLDSISELDGTNEKAVAAMRAGNYRDAAFEALKNFEYQELRVKIDGALDGPIDVFLKADGKNEDVLGGQPFLFNIISVHFTLASRIFLTRKRLIRKRTLHGQSC